MNIITKGTINYYLQKHPTAKTALLLWYHQFSKQRFKTFNELKNDYSSASLVGNSRVVFNIKGNDFRLVVAINFTRQAAYIIWFGTHGQYDKIDVATVPFDIKKI